MKNKYDSIRPRTCRSCGSKQVVFNNEYDEDYCELHIPKHVLAFRKLALRAMLFGRYKRLRQI